MLALQLRTPPLLAMAGASLQALAPERDIMIGVGISSPVVTERWHSATYGDRPLAQVREFVTLLRACLSGEPVDFEGDFYKVSKFRLGVRLPDGGRRPKIVIGALNEGMLRLAGEVADGVLLNYLPASHVPWSVDQVRKGGDATIYCYVHVGVTERTTAAVDLARRDLFGYATVDAYARNFTRAGYGDAVTDIRAKHAARDREGALGAVFSVILLGEQLSPGLIVALSVAAAGVAVVTFQGSVDDLHLRPSLYALSAAAIGVSRLFGHTLLPLW